ncbi:hypothetical protein MEA186_23146 [Mesorhizobium amorphae CCNWGS0123]|uniref:Uncharacterized protein n=1 Tax=Mesorhizobium amorphae CCNWGS0123 TaxID=1082933 RepID=G6YF82_9HYPH|nr:hypothetical protein MEA186_23146 [Mesorhizobium amorphae CCNWGS0123]
MRQSFFEGGNVTSFEAALQWRKPTADPAFVSPAHRNGFVLIF